MKVGNAPCSFGIMAGFEPDPPLTYTDVLDQIAQAGYAGTELGDWGFMPDDASVLKPELEKRGLALVGAFTPVALTEPSDLDASTAVALRAARLLAACVAPNCPPAPYVILAASAARHPHRKTVAGRVGPDDGLAGAEWDCLAGSTNSIARRVLEETGVRTVFHPHCATPVETFAETERFVAMTDPALIGLCFDTGHVLYGGDDPVRWLQAFGERVQLVHFKDMDRRTAGLRAANGWDYTGTVREGLFTELGEGCVDFPAVGKDLGARGYDGWVIVEDEIPPGRVPPLDAAMRDREYLRGLGL
jgi:inosose dehydratase